MQLCKYCANMLRPWSVDLTQRGFHGCNILMHARAPSNYQDLIYMIDADDIGLGWVTNGAMATNSQLLVKNVRRCPFYAEY